MSAKPWRIHAEAEQERDRAAADYADVDVELGADFRDALREAIAARRHTPDIGTAVKVGKHHVRRCRIRRFPFALVFVELDAEYLVLAVAHVRQRPGYWKKRLRAVR
jgi:hypothetical protein